jgi:hypothetical protein
VTQTEQLKSTQRKSKAKKICFQYVHIFWQAIPESGGIVTKACLAMRLGPRLWDSKRPEDLRDLLGTELKACLSMRLGPRLWDSKRPVPEDLRDLLGTELKACLSMRLGPRLWDG